MLTLQRNQSLRQLVQHQDAKILIVDDQPANVLLLERLLEEAGGYTQIRGTNNPREVFLHLVEFEPDLILLDLVMPEMSGFEVMEQLKLILAEDSYLPILVLTADVTTETKQKALVAGANDFLTKPFEPTEVLLRIRNLLQTRFLHLHLEKKVHERTEALSLRTSQLEEAQIEMLERLALSAEYRDDDTGQHIERVGVRSAALAKALGLPDSEVELLRRAAPLHDLGKIGIPDSILLKPGRITDEEYEHMKAHTLIGAKILADGHSEMVQVAECIALSHHERWDGSGYPHGLKGDQIPLAGRIVAVVDVYDALTSVRPYKSAWSKQAALELILQSAGQHFDPLVATTFVKMMKEME